MVKKTFPIVGSAIALTIFSLGALVHAATAAPKVYVIADIVVTDPEAYKAYIAAVGPVVAHFSGEYRVRGGQVVSVEGEPPKGRIVVIEFRSLAAARAFEDSAEYAAVAPLRLKAASSRIFLVEGGSRAHWVWAIPLSTSASASLRGRVISSSASLGSEMPEGCGCAKITAAAAG